MRSVFLLSVVMMVFNFVSADQTLDSLKFRTMSIIRFQQNRAHCVGNRLRGGSGGVGLESGRNEMIKRARSFELVRITDCKT